MVLNEIAQMRILFFTDRSFQRNRLLRDFHNLAYSVNRGIHLLGNFFRQRLTTKLLQQLAGNADKLINRFYHMYRNTDCTRLVCNRTGNSLTNPPGSIGTELKALVVVKFIYSLNQAQVALLNQIQKQHATTNITLSNAYY